MKRQSSTLTLVASGFVMRFMAFADISRVQNSLYFLGVENILMPPFIFRVKLGTFSTTSSLPIIRITV